MGTLSSSGGAPFERVIHVRQVAAIQRVEVLVVGRMMLRAVPPVPVAALGDQQFFPRQLSLRLRNPMRVAVVVVARLGQQVPRPVVLGSANPHVEVGVDPRAGHQALQSAEVLGIVPLDGFADGDGLDLRIALQPIVEAAQEFASRLRVVLPRILAVEDDRHDRIAPCIQNRLRRILNVVDEVIGGVLRRHARVHEAHIVRDAMVAKDQVHLGAALFVAVDVVELVRAIAVQPSAADRARSCGRASGPERLRRWPSTGCPAWPPARSPLRRRFPPRATALADEPRNSSRAPPVRAGFARSHPPAA